MSDERRESAAARRPWSSPMAVGALREIQLPCRTCPLLVVGQARRPRHLVRVDVEQAGLRIERRAAPLRAAVEARKDDRLLADARAARTGPRCGMSRNCSSAHWCASGVRLVSMSSVSICRANGAGFVGSGCVSRGDLARRPSLGGYFAILDREQRLAGRALEQEHVARAWWSAPRRRRVCRRASRVTRVGRRRKIAIPDVVLHAPENARCACRYSASSASSVLAKRLSPTRLAP